MTKNFLLFTILSILPLSVMAQSNGSNSSYSRYGLGTLDEQSQTFNRGMGGVAIGLRSGKNINMQNPASYSATDSLSFLFDIGMSMQYGHLSTSSSSVNAKNTSLSNVSMGFRAAPGLGMSLGFVPFSSIGYQFTSTGRVGNGYTTSQIISSVTTYAGNGGIHQVYLGAGWNPFAKLSVGANVSYLWGDYTHSMAQTFYEGSTVSSSYNSQTNNYTAEISTYKVDLGIQYPIRLNKQDWMTLGATYSLGHNVNNDATLERYTSAKDTVTRKAENAFSLPHTFGGGISWTHKDQLVIAADVIYELWDGCKLPVSGSVNNDLTYAVSTDQYKNRSRYKLGMEYTPDAQNRNRYLDMIRYRLGFNYSTPYTKVNGYDGPYELRVTAGLGLPLQSKKMSGRSIVNVSAEWMMRKTSTANLVKENYVMLNIGVTFNERWFQKWKIE